MDIASKVIKAIAEQLNKDAGAITLENDLVADLGADSLDAVEIIMNLEEEFDITVPDVDASQIKTVGDIVKLIEDIKNS